MNDKGRRSDLGNMWYALDKEGMRVLFVSGL